ncbi:Ferritin [Fasciolopsis buskii]|uniref:Ferritin n=1 Tax=Fasciolopsis buskii TaxID=27845 RepID=A0A8E0S438_9TREM|nr:Ferritin [Fasciolopsis buski]
MHARSNFPKECENTLNELISRWWSMERTYSYMSSVCGSEMNLSGFRSCFRLCSLRSRIHMETFLRFLIIRGGAFRVDTVKPQVQIPENLEGGMGHLMHITYDLESEMEQKLRDFYALAKEKNDINTCEFIESGILRRQMEALKWCVYHITGLRNCNNDFAYDKIEMLPMTCTWKRRNFHKFRTSLERGLLFSFDRMSLGQPMDEERCLCLFRYGNICLCKCEDPAHIQGGNTTEDHFGNIFEI